jgi:hypothetical protein
MPAPRLLELADLCVVFEDTWQSLLARVQEGVFNLPADAPKQSRLPFRQPDSDAVAAAAQLREKRAVVIHSVPLPEAAIPDPAAAATAGVGAGKASPATAAAVGGHKENDETHAQQSAATLQELQRAELVQAVIKQAKSVAGTVFITELSERYYESFSRGWREWAGLIGA